MKRVKRFAAFAILLPSAALATSSGSFTAAVDNTACTINGTNGTLSAPIAGAVYLTPVTGLQVQVPTSTDIVITPSLVTGLYTDNKLSSSNSSSLQNVGLFVQVTIEPTSSLSGPIQISPNTTATGGTGQPSLCTLPAGAPPGSATSCAIYDQRFVQVSSSVISGLASCVLLGTTGAVTGLLIGIFIQLVRCPASQRSLQRDRECIAREYRIYPDQWLGGSLCRSGHSHGNPGQELQPKYSCTVLSDSRRVSCCFGGWSRRTPPSPSPRSNGPSSSNDPNRPEECLVRSIADVRAVSHA